MELYHPCSKNKGADQLRSYCKADLRLCFRLCRLLVFPCGSSNYISMLEAKYKQSCFKQFALLVHAPQSFELPFLTRIGFLRNTVLTGFSLAHKNVHFDPFGLKCPQNLSRYGTMVSSKYLDISVS